MHYRIETRNGPHGHFVRDADPYAKCVRIYPGSPEDIILQIWGGKRYMLVALLPSEARKIAAHLMSLAAETETEGGASI
jgi:hypothetical protein